MNKKEAIEVVRKNYPHVSESNTQFETALRTLVPELQESEDERIRKALITFFQRFPIDSIENAGTNANEAIAWLEKQGESIDKEKVEIGARKDLALSIINYLDNNRVEGCMDLSSVECEDIEDACINSKWTKLYNYMKKKLETQNNTDKASYDDAEKENDITEETNAPTEYGKYVDECLNEAAKHFFSEGEDKYSVADLFYAGVRCGESWLEKQDEPKDYNSIDPHFGKPIDTKSKFKVGDWIFSPAWGTARIIGTGTIGANESDFLLEYTDGTQEYSPIEYVNSAFDKWTIQNVKNGDVLASGNSVFIFRVFHGGWLSCHCSAHRDRTCITDSYDLVTDKYFEDIFPATKEQREFLYQTLKENGYEWDNQKKLVVRVP